MNQKIVFIDDEARILKAVKRCVLDARYDIFCFTNPTKALDAIDDLKPAVVVTDQRMPGILGTDLLSQVRRKHPQTVRMLLTGYADVSVAMNAVNQGHVFRIIEKPWQAKRLKAEIETALDYYCIICSRKKSRINLNDKAIIEKERLQGAQEMANAICHEFSQPLQVITGYASLLLAEIPQRHPVYKQLSIIMEKVDNMIRMTRSIRFMQRYVTRPYPGGMQIFDIQKARDYCSLKHQKG